MNYRKLEHEIFNCEDWGIMNRLWFDEKIIKAHKAEEITEAERVKLFTLIADEIERYWK